MDIYYIIYINDESVLAESRRRQRAPAKESKPNPTPILVSYLFPKTRILSNHAGHPRFGRFLYMFLFFQKSAELLERIEEGFEISVAWIRVLGAAKETQSLRLQLPYRA